jgi:hypothetical protein
VTRRIAGDIESTYSHSPDGNEIVLAHGENELRPLREQLGDRLPARLAAFFGRVAEVRLPDLWNGYFIGPPTWSAGLHEAAEPRFVRTHETTDEVVVIASNGGGVLYAATLPSGGPILVLPNGGIENGVYDARDVLGFGPVADGVDEFVRRLAEAASRGDADPFDPYRRT